MLFRSNANDVTRRHMHITHAPTIEVGSMDQVPAPISKALFSTEEAYLPELLAYLKAQPWYNDYELVPSAVTLVELTAKGANKGGMVSRLAQLLGVRRENVLCVGDHANDVSMLTWAGEGVAMGNAREDVKSQVRHVCGSNQEDGVARYIESLLL